MGWPGNPSNPSTPFGGDGQDAPSESVPEGPNERDLLLAASSLTLTDGTVLYWVNGRFIDSEEYSTRVEELNKGGE